MCIAVAKDETVSATPICAALRYPCLFFTQGSGSRSSSLLFDCSATTLALCSSIILLECYFLFWCRGECDSPGLFGGQSSGRERFCSAWRTLISLCSLCPERTGMIPVEYEDSSDIVYDKLFPLCFLTSSKESSIILSR